MKLGDKVAVSFPHLLQTINTNFTVVKIDNEKVYLRAPKSVVSLQWYPFPSAFVSLSRSGVEKAVTSNSRIRLV